MASAKTVQAGWLPFLPHASFEGCIIASFRATPDMGGQAGSRCLALGAVYTVYEHLQIISATSRFTFSRFSLCFDDVNVSRDPLRFAEGGRTVQN